MVQVEEEPNRVDGEEENSPWPQLHLKTIFFPTLTQSSTSHTREISVQLSIVRFGWRTVHDIQLHSEQVQVEQVEQHQAGIDELSCVLPCSRVLEAEATSLTHAGEHTPEVHHHNPQSHDQRQQLDGRPLHAIVNGWNETLQTTNKQKHTLGYNIAE